MTSSSKETRRDNFPGKRGPSVSPVSASYEKYEIYTEGDDLFEAMLAAIKNAKEQVWLATYIFSVDEIGRHFIASLTERAQAGVDVRLVIDALGSFLLFPHRVEKELSSQGVKVHRYHRWHWREPLRYNRRDHRKLLVVDGAVAFLGGFNIHRESSLHVFGEKRWRDTHVKITGELAKEASDLFNSFWKGKMARCPSQIVKLQDELLPNHSRSCRQRLRCIYRDMFNSAVKYLYVTTPYFVPDRPIQKGLIAAARRGVDVRVLVPRKSDVRLVEWASRAAYTDLLVNGVRIFEYLPRMLHAKTMVMDDNFATIGTSNIDYRSFFLNYELNLFSRNSDLSCRLHDLFISDLEDAEEIYQTSWKQRHWILRFLEWVGWMARRWL